MCSDLSGRLLVFGAGGHGRVVADVAHACGIWHEIAFIDDRFPGLTRTGPWPVIGAAKDLEQLRIRFASVALGIGDNAARVRVMAQVLELGFALPAIVHPSASVSQYASLGKGTVVFPRAIVNIGAEVGDAVIVNSGAIVEHDCRLKTGVHISPGAALAGAVQVAEESWIGIGAAIRQGVRIGRAVKIGAGAVLLNDVADGQTMIGVPAAPIRSK